MSHNHSSRSTDGAVALAIVLAVLAVVLFVPVHAHMPSAANPDIATMMAQVQTATLMTYANQLTGETPATIGGQPYTFSTRETTSGTPITKATQFAYEFMQARGLDVRYANWNACGLANRNVIAEKSGASQPSEVVLVTAHIDNTSDTGAAPGADDDASGVAAVMAIAEILAPHTFQRTLQFVIFTGEEQGLCGSEAFARQADADHLNIVAVYNMDMIAYDSDSEPILRLHTRTTRNPGYAADEAIANTFIGVVTDYGLSGQLTPLILADGLDESDTYSFWEWGFPGVLAIEDDGPTSDDFNPNYHSSDDRVNAFNQTYYTNFVKASVGTAATLARVAIAATPTPAPTVGPYKLHLPTIRR